jgi:ferritin-like metal-binding protein YciE
MEGIIEGEEMIESDIEPAQLEAALIGAAQREEHYEIAAYGTAWAHARQPGFMKVANILGQTLEEVKQTNYRSIVLAENKINVVAPLAKRESGRRSE